MPAPRPRSSAGYIVHSCPTPCNMHSAYPTYLANAYTCVNAYPTGRLSVRILIDPIGTAMPESRHLLLERESSLIFHESNPVTHPRPALRPFFVLRVSSMLVRVPLSGPSLCTGITALILLSRRLFLRQPCLL